MTVVTVYTTTSLGIATLVYGRHLLGKTAVHVEYISENSLPNREFGLTYEQRRTLRLVGLGKGHHDVPYQEHTIQMVIEHSVEGKVICDNGYRDFMKVIHMSLKNAYSDEDPESIISAFVKDAKAHLKKLYRNFIKEEDNQLTKYTYNLRHEEWEPLSVGPCRSFETIFLEKGIKEKIMQAIEDFIDPETKKDYQKFNIPYKLNIMLHGKHGTGKSSTISAIATEINSDVAIINFTNRMDDAALVHAINNVSQLERCRVLVMEDIDSLFIDRKEHDTSKNAVTLSGLLNALDGLSRAEGLIVVMTTNKLDSIDSAMLRPGRVDLLVHFKDASKDIIRDMYNFYFPEHAHVFESFYKHIQSHKVTASMLQQHFFAHRKQPDRIVADIHQLLEVVKERGKQNVKEDETAVSPGMYM